MSEIITDKEKLSLVKLKEFKSQKLNNETIKFLKTKNEDEIGFEMFFQMVCCIDHTLKCSQISEIITICERFISKKQIFIW